MKELENAFSTLAEAFNGVEVEINEEIKSIHQQIATLKEQIADLAGKQEAIARDRVAMEEIYSRHSSTS